MPDSPLHPSSDEEWEELMRPLRLQSNATPRPFFYARVHARLLAKADTAKSLLPGWLRWPAYVAVLGALVLAVSGDGAVAATAQASYPVQQLPR